MTNNNNNNNEDNRMTNNNNDNNEDNLIGLNEFIQDVGDIELDWGVDEDERPFPDSDEAIRALQDIAESVDELEAECYRLRAELKTSNAERDAARVEVCVSLNGNMKQAHEYAASRGWDCFK